VVTQQQVDRLGTVIEQVRTDLGNAPEPPIVTFSAATSLVDEYRTKVHIREFTLDVDEPPLIGGPTSDPLQSNWSLPPWAHARKSSMRRMRGCLGSHSTASM
jgi:hypothetical protein